MIRRHVFVLYLSTLQRLLANATPRLGSTRMRRALAFHEQANRSKVIGEARWFGQVSRSVASKQDTTLHAADAESPFNLFFIVDCFLSMLSELPFVTLGRMCVQQVAGCFPF